MTDIPVPPVDDWLVPGLPDWLVASVRERAVAPSTLGRASAVASLLRLWTTPVQGDPMARLLAPDPRQPCKDWIAALPDAMQAHVLTAALDEVSDLTAELAEVDGWFQRWSEADAHDAVRDWLRRRDHLAGIAALGLPGLRAALRPALESLDARASVAQSAFSIVDLRDDPHLDAVSWQHSEAWWGAGVGCRPRVRA